MKEVLGKHATHDTGMPTCVAAVDKGRQGIDTYAMGPAYLGASNTPFIVAGDRSIHLSKETPASGSVRTAGVFS